MLINKREVQEGAFYIPFSFEWLARKDEFAANFYSGQMRLMVGAGYAFSEKWIMEFEYMNWWSRPNPNLAFERNEKVFRLNFIYRGWLRGE